MTVQIDLWSDFVCPYCYAVVRTLERLGETHDLDIRWRAFELRPAGSPPMDPAYRTYIETTSRPHFERMMREQHGLEVNSGPFGIISRQALIADKFAEAQGREVGNAFHRATLEAYWLHGRDISDVAVLRDIAATVGLDPDAMEAALADSAYDRLVQMDIDQAHHIGINAVPAIIFEKRYYISGAQPYEVFRDVVEQIEAGTIEQAARASAR